MVWLYGVFHFLSVLFSSLAGDCRGEPNDHITDNPIVSRFYIRLETISVKRLCSRVSIRTISISESMFLMTAHALRS